MQDNEINWDKPLQDATNAYLDEQDIVEDFKGNTQKIDNAYLWEYKNDYFLEEDADEFLEWLQYGSLEILRQMGAE